MRDSLEFWNSSRIFTESNCYAELSEALYVSENAVLVHGWFFHPGQKVSSLKVGCEGSWTDDVLVARPREDVKQLFQAEPNAYLSGFETVIDDFSTSGPLALKFEAKLEDGSTIYGDFDPIELSDSTAHPFYKIKIGY